MATVEDRARCASREPVCFVSGDADVFRLRVVVCRCAWDTTWGASRLIIAAPCLILDFYASAPTAHALP